MGEARTLDPSDDKTVFSDPWMLGERVTAPWSNGVGQQDSLNKLLGHPIRFLRERIDAGAQLACSKPKYEFKQLAPRALFHRRLTDPDKQAVALGFDEANIREQKIWTLTTGCGIDFHFIDPYTALFAVGDDNIYELERDWPPGPRPKDVAQVEACLKLVADNDTAPGPHEEEILIETAIDYARHLPQRVILIEGQRLAELMIEHNVGVRVSRKIEIKRIDEDFFSEDE